MRILYIDFFYKDLDMIGGCRSLMMARWLVAHGHTVNLVTSFNSPTPTTQWETKHEEGMTRHWLGVPYSNTMGFKQRMKAFLRFAWRAGRFGVGLPADVVFAVSPPLTNALPAARISRALRVPMVFEVGDLWPETPIVMGALRNPLLKAAARWLERFAYRNSSRIVALSPGMKAGICRTGYLEEHVAVIPNCSDIGMFRVPAERGQEWRRAHPEIGDRPMVLYAGTLGRINGVGWLARCAAATAKLDPEIRFVTVGGGIETDQVRQEAERCGVLGSNFFMYPPVKKGDVLAILSACSLSTSVVINVPELWNNSANKFFDSLAAGRPIAINHPGWQAELLQASGAGLVLPYGDLPGAARLLVDKLRDPSWLPDARVAAARLAEERFSSELLGQHLETVFLAAVADHGQPQVRRG